MLFAQIEHVPADALKNWILIAAGVIVIIVQAKELFGAKKRREVSFEQEPASKIEFDRHVDANEQVHRDLFAKVGGVERGAREGMEKKFDLLRNERAHDIAKIQSDLNAISVQLGVVEAQNKFQNDVVKGLKDTLDRWVGRSRA